MVKIGKERDVFMKKLIFGSFIAFVLLVLSTSTVLAGSALELVEVRSDDGVPTFVFRVTGEFSPSELESGFVQVEGGEVYPLYCAQVDATTVVCHTSKVASGHAVIVGFGGAKFWDFVPESAPRAPVGSAYCYNVYDWDADEGGATQWFDWGDYCQDTPAQVGDGILWDNPSFGIEPYIFGMDDSVGTQDSSDPTDWPSLGPGYYYNGASPT